MAYPTTTEHSKLYPFTSIMASPYSCDPTGAINCAAAIEQLKANQSSIGTILIPKGTFLIGTNLTIPATMTLLFESGGSFSVSVGKTLTVNATIRGPAEQIFSGAGTVTISSTTNPIILGVWTGGSGVKLPAFTTAGYVKNAVTTGLLSSGTIATGDIPSNIDPAKIANGINATQIADGSVNNTEFQYINSVTSNVQTQINNIIAGSVPATLYALIQDQKATGVSGGTFTAGAWQTRDLNTEVVDTNNIVTVAANQFTLQVGTYRIRATAPIGGNVIVHKAKLYNVTDAADVAGCLGIQRGSGTTDYWHGESTICGEFTIAGAKAFEIRHYCTNTYATIGYGKPINIAGYVEIYTQVEIWKVA